MPSKIKKPMRRWVLMTPIVGARALVSQDVSPDVFGHATPGYFGPRAPMPPAGVPLLTYDAPLTLRVKGEEVGSVRRPDRDPLPGHRAAFRHVDHRDREILSRDVRLAASIDERVLVPEPNRPVYRPRS